MGGALLLDVVGAEWGEASMDPSESRAVETHLAKCDACRRAYEGTRGLLGALADAKRGQESAFRSSARGHPSGDVWTPTSTGWRPGDVLGDFEIIGEVGRGGMGVVYRARQISLNRVVALKVLPSTLGQTAKAVTRFKKEARAAAKMHHTNIVPVYAQGEHEGHFYYAMELVDGSSLAEVIKADPARVRPGYQSPTRSKDGTVTPIEETTSADVASSAIDLRSVRLRQQWSRLALLVSGAAEGLAHAHKQGVIHRDIKPQNLMLGTDGQLHIMDFGLARLLDEPSVTVTGEMLGTPAYMSSEQIGADRKKIDHRTDIYSLGVTLYELLTGQQPFTGATREQIIARIYADEPRPPRKLSPQAPIDLDTICMRAMEKDPRRRYQSAAEMAADLRRFAEDRPILSRRVSAMEKAVKWVRRHPAITAIIFLGLTIAIGATLWTVQTVKDRHTRANALTHEAIDLLVFEDYRDPTPALAKLAGAGPLGPDESLYRKALALAHLLDDPKLAVEHLTAVLKSEPDDTDLMYLMAWALRRDGRAQTGRLWIEQADVAGGPKTASGWFFLGQAVVRSDWDDRAENAYREATRRRDHYVQAQVHLGRALNYWMYHRRQLDNLGEGLRALDSACAFQQSKAYPRYLLSIAHRLAGEIVYENVGSQDDRDRTKEERERAEKERKRAEEHFSRALRAAESAQKAEPSSSLGSTCEAEYWESRGELDKAIDAMDRGDEYCVTPSERSDLYQYRWRLLYWDGRLDRAMADLEQLARLCPDGVPLHAWYSRLFRALVLNDLQKRDQAIDLAREVATDRPEDFRAVTSAAVTLRILGRAEEADALLASHSDRIDFDAGRFGKVSADMLRAFYALCRRKQTLEELRDAAGKLGNDKRFWAAPYFLAATEALGRADRETALGLFRQCEHTYDDEDYCYLAKVFVRKMEADPAWPPR